MILTGIIHIYSIVAGCIMLLLAFVMCVLEATIICSGVSYAQPIIQRIDKIKNWHRGALYCGYVLVFFNPSTQKRLTLKNRSISDSDLTAQFVDRGNRFRRELDSDGCGFAGDPICLRRSLRDDGFGQKGRPRGDDEHGFGRQLEQLHAIRQRTVIPRKSFFSLSSSFSSNFHVGKFRI